MGCASSFRTCDRWRPHEDSPRLDSSSAAGLPPRRRGSDHSLAVAQLTIVASAPPLPPADAARTLQRASPDLDLSRGLFRLEELPIVLNVSPSTSDGSTGSRRACPACRGSTVGAEAARSRIPGSRSVFHTDGGRFRKTADMASRLMTRQNAPQVPGPDFSIGT